MLKVAWKNRFDLSTWSSRFSFLSGTSFSLIVIAYLSKDLPDSGLCIKCFFDNLKLLDIFIIFWFVELICFAMILGRRLIADNICLISFITLIFITLLSGGKNDFMMRCSMGPLFILALRSVQTIIEWPKIYYKKVVIVIAICICLPASVSEVIYQRQGGSSYRLFQPGDPFSVAWIQKFANHNNYKAQQFLEICGTKYLKQYFTTHRPLLLRERKSNQKD